MFFSDDLFRLTRRLCFTTEMAVQPLRWKPAADIYEIREGWLIKLELAGVRPEDIEFWTGGQFLCVRGRRYDLDYEECCKLHALEILYSQFQRCFEFPCNLEHAQISTETRNGMMLLRIMTMKGSPL